MRMLLWSEKATGKRDADVFSKNSSGCMGADRIAHISEMMIELYPVASVFWP
jgi:hypothetical protein